MHYFFRWHDFGPKMLTVTFARAESTSDRRSALQKQSEIAQKKRKARLAGGEDCFCLPQTCMGTWARETRRQLKYMFSCLNNRPNAVYWWSSRKCWKQQLLDECSKQNYWEVLPYIETNETRITAILTCNNFVFASVSSSPNSCSLPLRCQCLPPFFTVIQTVVLRNILLVSMLLFFS